MPHKVVTERLHSKVLHADVQRSLDFTLGVGRGSGVRRQIAGCPGGQLALSRFSHSLHFLGPVVWFPELTYPNRQLTQFLAQEY